MVHIAADPTLVFAFMFFCIRKSVSMAGEKVRKERRKKGRKEWEECWKEPTDSCIKKSLHNPALNQRECQLNKKIKTLVSGHHFVYWRSRDNNTSSETQVAPDTRALPWLTWLLSSEHKNSLGQEFFRKPNLQNFPLFAIRK